VANEHLPILIVRRYPLGEQDTLKDSGNLPRGPGHKPGPRGSSMGLDFRGNDNEARVFPASQMPEKRS